jgi:chromosome segregation ATPase
MNQDRDLPMGDIDHLSVDDDRRQAARKQAAQAQGGKTGGGDEPPRRPRQSAAPRPAAPARSGGGGFWIASTVILLIVALGMGAFMYRELSMVRAQLDNRLSESTERLGSLASQLSAADESFSQSAGQVQQRLDEQMNEIRKLWDVANKRNKGWIEENQAAIRTLQGKDTEMSRTLATLRNELNTAKNDASTAKQQVTELRATVQQTTVARNQMQTQLDLSQETLRQLESRVAAQQKTLEDVRGLLPQLQALASAQGQGGGIATRLREVEAAISAFDEYRRQVNARLDALQAR